MQLEFKSLQQDFSAYFALPPKCGTTSYQRALGAELSQYDRKQVHLLTQSGTLSDEFPEPVHSSDLHAPHIYDIMTKFMIIEIVNIIIQMKLFHTIDV